MGKPGDDSRANGEHSFSLKKQRETDLKYKKYLREKDGLANLDNPLTEGKMEFTSLCNSLEGKNQREEKNKIDAKFKFSSPPTLKEQKKACKKYKKYQEEKKYQTNLDNPLSEREKALVSYYDSLEGKKQRQRDKEVKSLLRAEQREKLIKSNFENAIPTGEIGPLNDEGLKQLLKEPLLENKDSMYGLSASLPTATGVVQPLNDEELKQLLNEPLLEDKDSMYDLRAGSPLATEVIQPLNDEELKKLLNEPLLDCMTSKDNSILHLIIEMESLNQIKKANSEETVPYVVNFTDDDSSNTNKASLQKVINKDSEVNRYASRVNEMQKSIDYPNAMALSAFTVPQNKKHTIVDHTDIEKFQDKKPAAKKQKTQSFRLV